MPDSCFPRRSAVTVPDDGSRIISRTAAALGKLFAVLCIGILALAGSTPGAPPSGRAKSAGHPESRVRSVPEYDRTMKRVLLSLDAGQSSLKFHREILAKLPGYTEVLLLVPRERVEPVTRELGEISSPARIRLVPFESEPAGNGVLHFIDQAGKSLVRENIVRSTPLQFGTIWSQDLLEPVRLPDGKLRLVSAPVHLCLWTESAETLSGPVSDNRYLSALSTRGLEVGSVPVAFKGGNLLIARAGSRTIAFCGSDILGETRAVSRSFPALVAADSLLDRVITGALGVDRTVFIGGNRPQPRRMYHLDQAMLPLSGGVVAVTRITGDIPADPRAKAALDETGAFLETLRETLKSLGFTVTDMDTPARSVLRSNFYVNAIPFTDSATGRRTILLPVFGDPGETEALRANTQRLSGLGYTVVTVPCGAGSLKGGIHCLVNVLE